MKLDRFFAIEARAHWRRFILVKTLAMVYFGKNIGDGLFWQKCWRQFFLAKILATVYFGGKIFNGLFWRNIGDVFLAKMLATVYIGENVGDGLYNLTVILKVGAH
jgi:hypothetical protein